MKKVACFFTGDYAGSNAMLSFLRKINKNVCFKQLCPNRIRRRKRPGMEGRIEDEGSELTGNSLLKYVYNYLTEYKDEVSEYDAIMIEDDLDGRFTEEVRQGDALTKVSRKTQDFINHCSEIRKNVRDKLEKDESFPVILLFAAPEIESWFLADWEHTFGLVYGPQTLSVLTAEANRFFSERFSSYVQIFRLCEYASNIENYGYHNGVYRKLSDGIIVSLDRIKAMLSEDKKYLPQENGPYVDEIYACKNLYYSKKLHGDIMLSQLSPYKVKKKCSIYFREAFDMLKEL